MAVNQRENSDITYDIKEHIGVIKTFNTGWQKELNIVSWNGGNPKYDIREWDMDHTKIIDIETSINMLKNQHFRF